VQRAIPVLETDDAHSLTRRILTRSTSPTARPSHEWQAENMRYADAVCKAERIKRGVTNPFARYFPDQKLPNLTRPILHVKRSITFDLYNYLTLQYLTHYPTLPKI